MTITYRSVTTGEMVTWVYPSRELAEDALRYQGVSLESAVFQDAAPIRSNERNVR